MGIAESRVPGTWSRSNRDSGSQAIGRHTFGITHCEGTGGGLEVKDDLYAFSITTKAVSALSVRT